VIFCFGGSNDNHAGSRSDGGVKYYDICREKILTTAFTTTEKKRIALQVLLCVVLTRCLHSFIPFVFRYDTNIALSVMICVHYIFHVI
jgi:hypothetical protein